MDRRIYTMSDYWRSIQVPLFHIKNCSLLNKEFKLYVSLSLGDKNVLLFSRSFLFVYFEL